MIRATARPPLAPKRAPGPGFRLPGRQLLAFRRDPIGMLSDLAATYGDIVQFRFAGRPAFLLNHPDFIQQVLVTESHNFTKGRALHQMRRVLGHGLLTAEGERHRQARRLVQPAFQHQRLMAYAATMAAQAASTAEQWQPAKPFDIAQAMNYLTLRIVGQTLFSADLSPQVARIADALDALLGFSDPIQLLLAPLLGWLPTPAAHRYRAAHAYFDALIFGLIDARRGQGLGADDLLGLLLASVDGETGQPVDDVFIRDQALTLLLAGHETTANALAWCWHLLAAHPETEARLHAELDRLFPQGETPTLETVSELVYTRAVLSESMRLYPPAWAIGRSAAVECSIGGYTVPAGSMVILSQWVTHRDDRYFAEADAFRPERWLEAERSPRPKFAYFPFGGGPRVCIGAQFALTEGILLLATLARRWRMRPVDNRPVLPEPRVTLRPKGGLWMAGERRL